MDIHTIKPIKKNVILDVYEWPSKSKGGIWIPEILQYSETRGGKDPWRGRIVAIGKEVTQVNVGEICRYQPDNYSRQTVRDDDYKRYVILDESLIYAIEDENENLLRALENRFVFLPDKLPEKYGLIYLPQKREEPLLYGTIVVAGKNAGVETGDRVILENKNTWQYFDSDGKRYILTDRFNLLGTFQRFCSCNESTLHSAGTLSNGKNLIICTVCGGELKSD